jgi:hypothetical protein
MCDIADTVKDGVAPDSKVAVILLTQKVLTDPLSPLSPAIHDSLAAIRHG